MAPSHYLNQCCFVISKSMCCPLKRVQRCTPIQSLPGSKVNSLAPGRFKVNFQADFGGQWRRYLLWNCPHMSVTGPYLWWVNMVQVMDWCRQARSHHLSQCWPRSISPYGVTRPQWVNILCPSQKTHLSDISLFLMPVTPYRWQQQQLKSDFAWKRRSWFINTLRPDQNGHHFNRQFQDNAFQNLGHSDN